MMARLMSALVGFALLSVLSVCDGEHEDLYMTGVKLAEQQINTHAGIQHHFRFFKSIRRSDIEVTVNDYQTSASVSSCQSGDAGPGRRSGQVYSHPRSISESCSCCRLDIT